MLGVGAVGQSPVAHAALQTARGRRHAIQNCASSCSAALGRSPAACRCRRRRPSRDQTRVRCCSHVCPAGVQVLGRELQRGGERGGGDLVLGRELFWCGQGSRRNCCGPRLPPPCPRTATVLAALLRRLLGRYSILKSAPAAEDGSSSDSSSSSGSSSSSSSSSGSSRKGASRFLMGSSDSESEDERRVVRSAKDKAHDELRVQCNDLKVRPAARRAWLYERVGAGWRLHPAARNPAFCHRRTR